MGSAEDFISDGFVRISNAFDRDLAWQGTDLLWAQTGCDPSNPATWTQPVIRLGHQEGGPFAAAANSKVLRAAYDELVGAGRWVPRTGLGTFPIRFPSAEPPGDDGWHVDVSFAGDDPDDFSTWRVNLASRGRALLMLFLFSDVGELDAPTRIRIGSHRDVARILQPHGANGLAMRDLAQQAAAATDRHQVALASGKAGDVYLCHPFLVHAAQAHHGTVPRFLAQPPLMPTGDFDPVAIRAALLQ
jgi:hypothetical protein